MLELEVRLVTSSFLAMEENISMKSDHNVLHDVLLIDNEDSNSTNFQKLQRLEYTK